MKKRDDKSDGNQDENIELVKSGEVEEAFYSPITVKSSPDVMQSEPVTPISVRSEKPPSVGENCPAENSDGPTPDALPIGRPSNGFDADDTGNKVVAQVRSIYV